MAIDRTGVRVARLVSGALPVGPDAMEREREAAIIATVRALIKEHKITTKNAVFAMPGQTVFFKRQRLPRARNPHDQRRIIHYEARQLIPFPLEKTILQYQVFPTDNDREIEVLLMAVKRETSQDFMRLVRRIGLRPIAISVSTLALFNGQEISRFEFDHWQAASAATREFMGIPIPALLSKATASTGKKRRKRRKGAEEEEVEAVPKVDLAAEAAAAVPDLEEEEAVEDLSLGIGDGFEEVRAYVNIGARSTDLAICKAGGAKAVGFTRSIPIGGRDITNAVLADCHFETFTLAEEAKIERGAVLSGTFEIEGDRERFDERVCAAATRVCDRIIAEVRRTLDFFVAQADGTAVDMICLSGGASRLPYLDSYFEERLGLPAEISSTLGNEGLRPSPQYADGFDCSRYKVAIGLASQGIGISPIEIDFLPADIASIRDFSRQYAEVVVLAGMIGGMVFFGSQIGSGALGGYRAGIEEMRAIVANDEPLRVMFESAKADRLSLGNKAKTLVSAFGSRDFWLRFLLRIERIKPPEILLTLVRCQPNHSTPTRAEVALQGEAEQNASVTAFLDALKAEKEYIQFAELTGQPMKYSRFFLKNVQAFTIQLVVQDTGTNLVTRLLPPPAPQGAVAASGPSEAVQDFEGGGPVDYE
ncbi:pilus assembly protein PilM [Candidatus Sumerlaeota bacterium]|nr:pilus assembly protein PilM [Candidatus Sumerlaeota bacterium]